MTVASSGAAAHRRRPRQFVPGLMAMPAVAIVAALAIVPFGYGIYLSLTNWSFFTSASPHFQGFGAYRELFSDSEFWSAAMRTLWWTLGTVAIEIAVALPLALLLNRRTPVTGFVSGVLLLPWVTPFVVLSYAWLYLYDGSFGPFHWLLAHLHLVGRPSPLATSNSALWAVILISGWKGVPFLTVALLAARQNIPDELYEASAVDGATAFARFRDITLPLLKRTLAAMSFVLGVLAFYSFDLVWLTTKGGPGTATTLVGVKLYESFFNDGKPGYAAAMGTVTLLLLLFAAFVTTRLALRRRRA
jgi:multiple sugar transport system permease protein